MEKEKEIHENSKENNLSLHPKIEEEIKKIPNFLEVLLVMPPNPGKKIEKLIELRKLQAQKDEDKQQSIHEYYSQTI